MFSNFVAGFIIVVFLSVGIVHPEASVIEHRQASCQNTATSRNCWGEYNVDTDYEETWPDTGVTREVITPAHTIS